MAAPRKVTADSHADGLSIGTGNRPASLAPGSVTVNSACVFVPHGARLPFQLQTVIAPGGRSQRVAAPRRRQVVPRPFIRLKQLLGGPAPQPNIGGGGDDQRFLGGVAQEDLDPRAEAEVGLLAIAHLGGLHVRDDVNALEGQGFPLRRGNRNEAKPEARPKPAASASRSRAPWLRQWFSSSISPEAAREGDRADVCPSLAGPARRRLGGQRSNKQSM